MVALFRADTSSLDRGMVRARAGLQGVEADAAEATRGVNILGTAIDALTVQVARANTQLPGFVSNVRALGRALTTLNGNFDPAIVAAYVAALSSVGGVAATVNADVAGLRTDLAALNRTFGSMAPINYAGRMGTSSAALAQMQIDLAAAQAQLAQFNATLAQTRAINPRMAINTGGRWRRHKPEFFGFCGHADRPHHDPNRYHAHFGGRCGVRLPLHPIRSGNHEMANPCRRR